MPLLRTIGRTAVIAGTANRVQHRQEQRWARQAETPPQPMAAPPAAAPAPTAAGGPDKIEQLKELAGLKDQGILTEEEFAAEKAKILAS